MPNHQTANIRLQHMVSEEYKFCFLFIPKVANTSLRRAIVSTLFKYKNEKEFKWLKKHGITRITNNQVLNYMDFNRYVFVRNPYDRVVSGYLNKIAYAEKGVITRGLLGGISFEEFIIELSQKNDNETDKHFRQQIKEVSSQDGQVLYSHLFKFENINNDWKKLSKIFKKEHNLKLKSLKKLNVSEGRKPYKEYYNDKIYDLVTERFKDDIREFNYEF